MECNDSELFPADALAGIKPESREHSAAYMKERNPKLYKLIAAALGYGMPVIVIARNISVSENTVRAVAFAECSTVEEFRESLLKNLRKALHGAALRLAEELKDVPLDKLPAAIAALNQQVLLLEGNATSIVRHERGETLDDLESAILAAQRAVEEQAGIRTAAGHVVEDENAPAMGCEPGKKPSGDSAGSAALASGSDPLDGLLDGCEPLGSLVQVVDNQQSDGALYLPLYHGGRIQEGGEGGRSRVVEDSSLRS